MEVSSLEGGEERSCKLESDVLLGAVGESVCGASIEKLDLPGQETKRRICVGHILTKSAGTLDSDYKIFS